ncbi:MAG: SdrD B-like domain-containing protein, partial [bacterium]
TLAAGTFVVVVDVAGSSAALTGLVSSTGASTDTTSTGAEKDHGRDTPVNAGDVTGGIASTPVTVGTGLQPTDEPTGSGAGANGPNGDAWDNLAMSFGFTPAYSVGNRVWVDNGAGAHVNNGFMDDDETGLANVNLHLYAAVSGSPAGAVLADAWTDSSGYYRFDGVPAGAYVVVVHVLGSAGALNGLQSSAGASNDTTLAGDKYDHGLDTVLGGGSVLPGGIASVAFTLGAGAQPTTEATSGSGAGANGPTGDSNDNLTLDFGFAPSTAFYSIGNRVFRDDGSGAGTTNDGFRNGDEPGISNVTMKIFLADGSGSPSGSALQTTNTDVSGYYRFDSLPPGNYVVVVDVAVSTNLAGLRCSPVTTNGMTLAGDLWNHGIDAAVSVGDVTNGIASASLSVGAGLQPVGEAVSGSGAGTHGPSGDASDNLVVDFGFAPTFSIGNRVFRDDGSSGGTANDGIRSSGEPGITNVAIKLFAAAGNGSPTGSALASTNTDSNGYYRFDNLHPGTYVVVVDVAASAAALGTLVSSTGASTNMTLAGDLKDHGIDTPVSVGTVTNGIASTPVTIGAGLQPSSEETSGSGQGTNGPNGDASDNLALDFGFTPAYSIGHRVFEDLNNNGQQDAGDSGLGGVKLVLFAASGGAPAGSALATMDTDTNGYYRFDSVAAGSYVVVVD